MTVMCILFIIILFGIVIYLYHIVKKLCEMCTMQNKINKQLGYYIVENKKEIYAIKNSIYR